MSTATDIKHFVRDANMYGGKPRIAGHRIADTPHRVLGGQHEEAQRRMPAMNNGASSMPPTC